MRIATYGSMPISRSVKRNRNGVRYKNSSKTLGPIANTLVLMLIVIIMGLLYLTQVVKTSALSYQVNEMEAEKEELTEINQNLRIEAARLQSIERIRSSKTAKNLTPNDQVSYLNN